MMEVPTKDAEEKHEDQEKGTDAGVENVELELSGSAISETSANRVVDSQDTEDANLKVLHDDGDDDDGDDDDDDDDDDDELAELPGVLLPKLSHSYSLPSDAPSSVVLEKDDSKSGTQKVPTEEEILQEMKTMRKHMIKFLTHNKEENLEVLKDEVKAFISDIELFKLLQKEGCTETQYTEYARCSLCSPFATFGRHQCRHD